MSGSFNRPSFATLYAQAIAAFSSIPGVVPLRRRSRLVIEAKLLAAQADQQYGYLGRMIDRVLCPFTSVGIYLERWMNGLGIPKTLAATAAGSVIISGPASTPIPQGWLIYDPDNTTMQYSAQAPLTLTGGSSDTVAVVALTGGSAGNQEAGAVLTPVIGIAGVSANVIVGTAGITGGIDVESDADGQVRLQQRMSEEPEGGATWDYRTWAKTVAGVTRVWVYPKNRGPGTVDVAFMMDGRANPFPLTADIAAVQAAEDAKRPVATDCVVFALTPAPVAVTISNLVVTAGATIASAKAAVATALAALFATTTPTAPFGDGIPAGGTGGTLALEQIDIAIGTAAGVATFDLVAPSTDLTTAPLELLQLGTLTWS